MYREKAYSLDKENKFKIRLSKMKKQKRKYNRIETFNNSKELL